MKIKILTIIILFSSYVYSQDKNDWCKWRGPNGNGVSNHIFNDKEISYPYILWKSNIGKGHGVVLAQGDYCYANGWKPSTEDKDEKNGITTVYCLDTKTGKEKWHFEYPAKKIGYPGPRSSMLIDENSLYVLGWEGDLFCLATEDGQIIWKRNLPSDSLGQIPRSLGFCTSPAVYENMLLLGVGSSGLALDKRNGALIWKSKQDGFTASSPVVTHINGIETAIFGNRQKHFIIGTDVHTGKILWQHKLSRVSDLDPIQIGEDKLYIGNELIQFNGSQSNSLWSNPDYSSFFQNGVIIDGNSYQFGNMRDTLNNNFYCIDVLSGKENWKNNFKDQWGAVSGTANHLIIATGNGNLIIAKANPEKFIIVSKIKIFEGMKGRKNFCWTLPSESNGKIFVRTTNGNIACISFKSTP